MIDVKQLCKGTGYLIVESEEDTTNIICRFGHIYADGLQLCAATNPGADSLILRRLKALGKPIMDGDDGDLTVRFPVSRFDEVCRILRPRQDYSQKNSRVYKRRGKKTPPAAKNASVRVSGFLPAGGVKDRFEANRLE